MPGKHEWCLRCESPAGSSRGLLTSGRRLLPTCPCALMSRVTSPAQEKAVRDSKVFKPIRGAPFQHVCLPGLEGKVSRRQCRHRVQVAANGDADQPENTS